MGEARIAARLMARIIACVAAVGHDAAGAFSLKEREGRAASGEAGQGWFFPLLVLNPLPDFQHVAPLVRRSMMRV